MGRGSVFPRCARNAWNERSSGNQRKRETSGTQTRLRGMEFVCSLTFCSLGRVGVCVHGPLANLHRRRRLRFAAASCWSFRSKSSPISNSPLFPPFHRSILLPVNAMPLGFEQIGSAASWPQRLLPLLQNGLGDSSLACLPLHTLTQSDPPPTTHTGQQRAMTAAAGGGGLHAAAAEDGVVLSVSTQGCSAAPFFRAAQCVPLRLSLI